MTDPNITPARDVCVVCVMNGRGDPRVCVATKVDGVGILRRGDCAMPNFFEYNPEQAYLLPPSVRDVLGEDHLCFFVHRAVEKLDLQEFAAGYSDEGHPAYGACATSCAPRRAGPVSTTKSTGRAGHRNFERAARDEAVPDARAAQSGHRICPGNDRVEPDAHVAAYSTRRPLGIEQCQIR
jgi:hypothetical protein